MIKEKQLTNDKWINSKGEIRSFTSRTKGEALIPTWSERLKEYVIYLNNPSRRMYVLKTLMAMAFFDGYDPKTQKVEYIDGDSKNINLENLKVVERFPLLNEVVRNEIKSLRESGFSCRELAKKYNCSVSAIQNIVRKPR